MKDEDLIRIAHTGTTWEVGDIVVGNAQADGDYSITTEGVKLRVQEILNEASFYGMVIEHPDDDYHNRIGGTHRVLISHFDFYCKADDYDGELPNVDDLF